MSAATPPRIWALPEEPPVGTRVIDSDDCAWGRDHDAWRRYASRIGAWIEYGNVWLVVLRDCGPLREATPDDLARLGIDQKENR